MKKFYTYILAIFIVVTAFYFNSLTVMAGEDTTKPQYISSEFKKNNPNNSSMDTYSINVKDDTHVKEIKVTFEHRRTGRMVTLSKNDKYYPLSESRSGEEVTVNFQLDLANTFLNLSGFWDVSQIEIIDQNFNTSIVTNIGDSVYIDRIIYDLDARVIKEHTIWTGDYIPEDVYIMPGVILSTQPNVTIKKNVYVLGALRTYGGLSVKGTVFGKRTISGHTTPIYDGDVQIGGMNSEWRMEMSNAIQFPLPINTGGALFDNGDDTFDIVGLTLPLDDKITINEREVDLDPTGRFNAKNLPMNELKTADIEVVASNGVSYSKTLTIYDNQKPTVQASLDSGIYLVGTNINLTSTKDASIYYDLSYGSTYSGQFTAYDSEFILYNDFSTRFYSVDPTGIESIVDERSFRTFSIHQVKKSNSAISGSGSPGLNIHVLIDGKEYLTQIDADGKFAVEGIDLSSVSKITAYASDSKYISPSYDFDVIDDFPMVIKGVEDNKFYNHDVTIFYDKGRLYLDGKEIVSGTTISKDGTYKLSGYTPNGGSVKLSFIIDKTPPVIYGVQHEKGYKTAVTPVIIGGTDATLNGEPYSSGTEINQEGDYVLEVTDRANNKTIVRFTVDWTPPLISGIEDRKLYSKTLSPSFNEGSALLNGVPFQNGDEINKDGKYYLIVKDFTGNFTSYSFELDLTPPKVTGVQEKGIYREAVIEFTDGIATLNGMKTFSGYILRETGNYELIVEDKAGNKTFVNFEIDRVLPEISGFEDRGIYNTPIIPGFNEGKALLNQKPFQRGTVVEEDGTYVLYVVDEAGNGMAKLFTIDRTKPIVEGVTSNGSYKIPVTISFNEGNATLNGKVIPNNYTVNEDGSYELKVKDSAGNEMDLIFEIDQIAPVVFDVESRAYRNSVTPVFEEGNATLNEKVFVSGTTITADGDYELKVFDRAKNETIIRFNIDKIPVIVTGVESNKVYRKVVPEFKEGYATLNGVPTASGTIIDQSGNYMLIVKDAAGNETIVLFSVDNTPPIVLGFTKGISSYREIRPSFTEGEAILNDKPYISGDRVYKEGNYVLRVKDSIGNETTINFSIDRTAPIVTGVKSKQLTNQSVVIQYNEGTATLNGKRILKNWSVKTSGNYTLRVTDQAGNTTVLTFTIDKSAPTKPTVSTLTNKSTKVTGKAEKGSTAYITYNGRTYTTKATTAGTYSYSLKTTKAGTTVSVRAKDAAGNLSSTASLKVLNTFATFTVNTVKATATSLTGKGNKAATVQAFVGTKAISKAAKVDSKGNYKLTIPRQKAGVTVTVKMTQSGYQEMKKTSKVVK